MHELHFHRYSLNQTSFNKPTCSCGISFSSRFRDITVCLDFLKVLSNNNYSFRDFVAQRLSSCFAWGRWRMKWIRLVASLQSAESHHFVLYISWHSVVMVTAIKVLYLVPVVTNLLTFFILSNNCKNLH